MDPTEEEHWMEVKCDDECLNKTESSTDFSDVTAIRWTLTDCEDTEDAIMIEDLQAVVCAKLSGNICFFVVFFLCSSTRVYLMLQFNNVHSCCLHVYAT